MSGGGIDRVAVIGAGQMGHGIAQVAALAGFEVALHDVAEDLVRRGLARSEENRGKGVEKGKVAAADRDGARARLRGTTDLVDAARGATLVIEAAPEQMELKKQIFRRLGDVVSEDALLATNTSSLSVTEMAAAAPRPERFLGMHFFNPPHLMALLEVVRGERTSEGAVEAALEVARRMKKEAIVVKDSPGFASSRLGVVLGLEAIRMVEQGVASPAAIDKAMELGYRHPMGPLRLTDLVGLDTRLAIAEYLHKELGGGQYRPPLLLRQMVRAGKLGQKAGEGFYAWPEGKGGGPT